jgi:hypothetical protein
MLSRAVAILYRALICAIMPDLRKTRLTTRLEPRADAAKTEFNAAAKAD